MCLAIPAEVINIDGTMAMIDVAGVRRPTSLMLLSDVAVGDYVIVHAGFAIHKVDPGEAQASLRLFREMAATE